MPNHVRRQLREAVAAAVTGLTTTGARVFQSRVYPLQTTELPGLCVFTSSEEVDAATVHRTLQRNIGVRVTGYATAASDLDDTLDLISKEVEIALSGLLTIGSKQIYLDYLGADLAYQAGDKPHGIVAMNFRATIFTTAAAPDVPL